MKVVHLTTSVNRNSACARINDALLKQGIDSKILVLKTNNDYPLEIGVKSKYKKKLNNFFTYIEQKYINSRKCKIKPVFSISLNSIGCTNNDLINNADIVHIHWCNWGLLSIKDIYKLSKRGKKIVWTMHDSWGFTGGCHVRYECEKYVNGCNKCFILNSNSKIDLSYFLWKLKKIYYKKSNFSVIVPSEVHKKFAERSELLKHKEISVINNPIDKNKFKNIDKNIARNILGLCEDKKIILFGAIDAKNKYKGYNYLIDALKYYKKNNDISKIEIVIFGANDFNEIKSIGYKVECMGYVKSEVTMNLLYSASDLFISPSIEESFGQTFLESISSGTPCIGFKNTGAEEIIIHKKNGYLAKYKDELDLKCGIEYLLNNSHQMTFNIDKFSYDEVANKYIKIYEKSLLNCK